MFIVKKHLAEGSDEYGSHPCDQDALDFGAEMDAAHTFLINLMSAPGSGKTSVLCRIIRALKDTVTVGVLESDIDGDVDAYTVAEAGALSVQVHTGGMCHLDADMTRQSLKNLPGHADLVFLENIGNLVCPAEYATGAHRNIMILSVPEGDDKPFKYPLMFGMVDALIINKIDTAPYFDFDIERVKVQMNKTNPSAAIFAVSAKTGEGMDELCAWIMNEYRQWEAK